LSQGETPHRLVNPYQSCAPWFRANFHGHAHDDGSACDLVQAYVELGYSVIGVEPWYLPAVRERCAGQKVLLVSAPEDGAWPHLIAVAPARPAGAPGAGEGGSKPTSLQARIDALRDRGALAFVCHPAWSGIGARELTEVTGYLGIEIYNEAVQRTNGKGRSIETWDTLLAEGKRVWGVATDDAHSIGYLAGRRDVGQGWIVIQAESLEEEAVLRAVAAGAFYSSLGPEFHSIKLEGDRLTVLTSPCVEVHFVSAGTGGQSFYRPLDSPATEFTVDLTRARWLRTYLRIEIIDAQGRAAWSNPLFPAET
jgi:hypothetical protein